jgi:hypothetical protein
MLTDILKTWPPKPLNIKSCNEMLQFEEEPNKRKMIKWMVSVTGVSMSALKIIFLQQLDSLLLLQVMPVLVRWFANFTHTHTQSEAVLLAVSHHLCLELHLVLYVFLLWREDLSDIFVTVTDCYRIIGDLYYLHLSLYIIGVFEKRRKKWVRHWVRHVACMWGIKKACKGLIRKL